LTKPKVLAVYPVTDRDYDIYTLFKAINNKFQDHIDKLILIDETSNKKSIATVNTEINHINIPYRLVDNKNVNTRSESLIWALDYSVFHNFEYVVFFNEGWEDNQDYIEKMLKEKSYKNYTIVTSRRVSKKLSLGGLYDRLSSLLTSLVTLENIKETKGDSINIFRANFFKENYIPILEGNNFYHNLILISSLYGAKLHFSTDSNTLTNKSLIKLNTKRFIIITKNCFNFFFYKLLTRLNF
jgi:hypothetical protein